ncbi:MAG: nucleotidyltransferase [Bacillota bacterium]
MHVLGLIVEYNPFHNGHLYHIEQARKKSNADIVITVMSGQFLQRGEPAIIDKFTRAEMAVLHGSDLVIELPTIFAIQHRDLFCFSAVSILNQLGVDTIIFGSESGDITPFLELVTSEQNHHALLDQTVQHGLKVGKSYPAAYSDALKELGIQAINDHLPNNSLGIGYVRAVLEINPDITIDTIKRQQADYHTSDLSTPIASATSIRQAIKQKSISSSLPELKATMPAKGYQLLEQYEDDFHDLNDYYPLIQYTLLTTAPHALKQIHGMVEGIEHRLIAAAKKSGTVTSFIDSVKTKRYTTTRIQRLLVHLLLNLDQNTVNQAIKQLPHLPAVRSLAQSTTGEQYLKAIKKQRPITVLSKVTKDLPDYLAIDIRASRVYHLFDHQKMQREFLPPYRYERARE